MEEPVHLTPGRLEMGKRGAGLRDQAVGSSQNVNLLGKAEAPWDWSYACMSVGVQSGETLLVGYSPEFRGGPRVEWSIELA